MNGSTSTPRQVWLIFLLLCSSRNTRSVARPLLHVVAPWARPSPGGSTDHLRTQLAHIVDIPLEPEPTDTRTYLITLGHWPEASAPMPRSKLPISLSRLPPAHVKPEAMPFSRTRLKSTCSHTFCFFGHLFSEIRQMRPCWKDNTSIKAKIETKEPVSGHYFEVSQLSVKRDENVNTTCATWANTLVSVKIRRPHCNLIRM